MLIYTLRRLIAILPVLVVVSVIVFMIVHLTPGNPAYIILGEDSSPEAIKQLEQQLGLNQPMPVQFFHWIVNIFKGNLGNSVYSSEPVLSIILGRLGPTFSVMLVSMCFTLLIAVPLSFFMVWNRHSKIDSFFLSMSLVGTSIPEFWFAILLVMGLGVTIPLFPVAGYVSFSDNIVAWFHHLILPSFVLATVEIGLITRILREGMLEAINQDYTKTARSKGIKEVSVIGNHVFANALIPTTTVIGMSVAGLLGGTVIIETLFTIPGIGQLLIDSIHRRDYPIIQGVVLFISVTYVCINLLVDLLYGFLDPRIRYK